jgi:hypothetical protein
MRAREKILKSVSILRGISYLEEQVEKAAKKQEELQVQLRKQAPTSQQKQEKQEKQEQ